jgi:hypothetical protein
MKNSRTLKKRTSSKSASRSKSSSRSRSKSSRSKSKSRSKSRSSFSSSIGGPPVLRREYKKNKITKKEANEIIKYRVEKARNNPPENWEEWNKNNAKLFKNDASIPYPEYNEIFNKKYGFPF